jgi:hypothetical protein
MNAYVKSDGYWDYFKSYDTSVAKVNEYIGKVVLSQYWNYSASTTKQVTTFLNEYASWFGTVSNWNVKLIRELIKEGKIEIVQVPFYGDW